MPILTYMLLAITVLAYVAGTPMALALWPIGSDEFRPWQLVTYAFLHAGAVHITVNMLALMSFGPALERDWGWRKLLVCYLVAAAVGGALHAATMDAPVVGASASLFGLFAAWTMTNPRRKVVSVAMWPLEAWKVLVVYLVASCAAWAFGWLAVVSHAAHIGGAVVGIVYAANNKPRV